MDFLYHRRKRNEALLPFNNGYCIIGVKGSLFTKYVSSLSYSTKQYDDQQVVIMRISQDFKEEQMTDKGDLKCAEMACGILCVSRILANKMLQ